MFARLVSLICACAAIAVSQTADAAPIQTTAQLSRALQVARGGEVLRLAGGDYGVVVLSGMRFAEPVVVTAADPSRLPVFGGLDLTDVAGLAFQGIRIVAARPSTPAISITQSDRISFTKLDAEGLLQVSPGAVHDGMVLQRSAQITVSDSEFRDFGNGITHLNCDHLTIGGNRFHDIRVDGVHGGGSSFVTIQRNVFRDFFPLGVVGETGDHADAVQFWTTNTTRSAHDITVSENAFIRGRGRYIEGVFLRDEVGTAPYLHVAIIGNLLLGGMYNGIFVEHAVGLEVRDNLVAGYPDRQSYIEVLKIEGGRITGNSANEMRVSADPASVVSDNRIIPRAEDQGVALLTRWRTQHPGMIGLP
jgi:nitrous oxidase accessory protein NosD